jgi:hypothetical protein
MICVNIRIFFFCLKLRRKGHSSMLTEKEANIKLMLSLITIKNRRNFNHAYFNKFIQNYGFYRVKY